MPVPREEVEEAVRSLKAGKSPGVDNIPSELLKNGGNDNSPNSNMQEDLGDEGMAKEWTQPLIIPLPKKGNLKQRQN